MGWVILAVFVVLVGVLIRATNNRSRGSWTKDGPISRNSSVNYDNVQQQANGAQYRDGGGL